MRELRKETEIIKKHLNITPSNIIYIRNERTPKGDGNIHGRTFIGMQEYKE